MCLRWTLASSFDTSELLWCWIVCHIPCLSKWQNKKLNKEIMLFGNALITCVYTTPCWFYILLWRSQEYFCVNPFLLTFLFGILYTSWVVSYFPIFPSAKRLTPSFYHSVCVKVISWWFKKYCLRKRIWEYIAKDNGMALVLNAPECTLRAQNSMLGSHEFSLHATIDHHGLSVCCSHYTTSSKCCGKAFYCNDDKITACFIYHIRGSSATYIILNEMLVGEFITRMPGVRKNILPLCRHICPSY